MGDLPRALRFAAPVCAALLTTSALAAGQVGPAATERWFRILGPDGALIGYQHETVRPADGGGFERARLRVLSYRIDGHPVTRHQSRLVRHYDAAGQLHWFRSEQSDGRQRTESSGTIAAGTLTIRRVFAGKTTNRSLPWRAGLDLGDALASEQTPGFWAELSASGLRYDERRVVEIGSGDERARISTIGNRLAGFEVLRGDGTIVLPRLGYDLKMVPQSAPVDPAALARPPRLAHEMRTAPYFASDGALRGQIRYQFGWRFGLDWPVPQTGEQAVRREGEAWQRLRIDICATCGPGLHTDAGALDAARRPSPWIESDAPQFKRVAGRVRQKGSERAKMIALGKMARERMGGLDFEGHLSAAAAWRRGSGDCTEDAVVLAALARAAGIPARVASGIVYSRSRYHGAANAFLPHTWVVAYTDGRWQSYDVSLGGFDASHIALSIGDGEPGAIAEATLLAALLDWQGMAEVRKRE